MYNTSHKNELINLFKNNPNKTYSSQKLVEMYSSTMDKATVYRKLKQLENDKQIFKIFNIANSNYEYTMYDSCNNHMHLKCIDCGKVVHLKCSVVNEFTKHIENDHDFKIENINQTIYGKCKECR